MSLRSTFVSLMYRHHHNHHCVKTLLGPSTKVVHLSNGILPVTETEQADFEDNYAMGDSIMLEGMSA